ncbi:MAG: enoyl-CoA hydratase [Actinobacteria bacterium]|nr:enoyl-CoA hydratase [Actinomycetota bacterium]MSZ60016.1 enoyl-CoA hydratase [Actinomycetota bacterium]MSZ80756.1 enoyl-CoA hydratase [Actinomycetota bacterium]MTB12092.1 enoyl-CoA hydratase [Actinomycetota bacterium]
MNSLETVSYRVHQPGDQGIAIISLNRDSKRNAQNNQMTYELNACYDAAARDSNVKVIVLRAEGKHFSAGHDLRDRSNHLDFPQVFPQSGFTGEGQEGMMAHEEEVYFNMCWRWRNIPKPVIAAAQGMTIAGGLMLLWVADIIIASDDATFSDPVVAFGVNGVEYFGHPWEFGARKAKELLFTGDTFTAQEAMDAGMINRVVPASELDAATMTMAAKIATKPGFALKLAKESVNQTLEAQGQYNAFRAAFSLQHLGHANNKLRFGMAIDPSGL